jgi:hypothetical protein
MRRTIPLILFLVAGCTDAMMQPDPCPQGICVGGKSDMAGIPQKGDMASGGPCVEAWVCSPWTSAGNGMYTRKCDDANACGTTVNKPNEGPIPLPDLDLDFYKCKVEPIFDRGCAMMGCHGTAAGDTTRQFQVFARGRRRNTQQVPAMCLDQGMQDLAKGSGTIMCYGWSAHTDAEWQNNFNSARAQMVGVQNPDDCDLLAQPLTKAHTGVHLWQSKSDPDYMTISSWLMGAKLGSTCNPMN